MENNEQDFINIINATENNLKHVSLKIPKKQITVFTGLRLVLTPIFMRCCACFFLVSENLLSDIRIVFPSIIQAENVSAAKVLEL